jgi:nitroreductase
MHDHVSVREFVPGADIDAATLQVIIEAGRAASTWRALQSYSIIVVRDQAVKAQIADLIYQPSVRDCAVFLVFVGDLARAHTAAQMHGANFDPGLVESLLVTSVDASLCAQNALLAAESLGLGGCFIGMVRSKSAEISDLLGLVEYQYPLVGLVLGVPANRIPQRPRLPYNGVVFSEKYDADEAARQATILEYEANLVGYPDPRPMTFSERQVDQWGKSGPQRQMSSTQNLARHGFEV